MSAALAVVEPYGSGLGGGGFFLLREAAEPARHVFLDARERAPRAATPDLYLRDGQFQRDLSLNGPLAAAIPGTPAALVELAEQRGRLPLEATLAPAIALARDGFEVDAVYRQRASWRLAALRDDPSARLFLDEGDLPAEGHLLRQPELAQTLERLASNGRDGFYRGELAQKLVRAYVRPAASGRWTTWPTTAPWSASPAVRPGRWPRADRCAAALGRRGDPRAEPGHPRTPRLA